MKWWKALIFCIAFACLHVSSIARAQNPSHATQAADASIVPKGVEILDSGLEQDIKALPFRFTFGFGTDLLKKRSLQKRNHGDTFDTYIYNKSLRQVLKELQIQKGEIRIDCQLFAQIAGYVQQGRIDEKPFTLIKGPVYPEKMKEINSAQFGYSTAKDPKTYNLLFTDAQSCAWKGEWVVMAENGTWVGFTGQTLSMDKENWAKVVSTGFRNEVSQQILRTLQYDPEKMPEQMLKSYRIEIERLERLRKAIVDGKLDPSEYELYQKTPEFLKK